MSSRNLAASWKGTDLVISGILDESDSGHSKAWRVGLVNENRVFAFRDLGDFHPEKSVGFAKCSADMVYDLCTGIIRRKWSGMIHVDTGFGNKKIYFKHGELVFASSDLMDDRLGEVIYRDSIISLDQLTKFAVQVDRNTKFGQVLLRSGTFSTTDLWYSLKAQVREIFRSIFLMDVCYVEVHSNESPMEVSFEDGTDLLLEAAFSFGAQFRSFSRRLNVDVRIHLGDPASISKSNLGTFVGDFIELCKDTPAIDEVLARSQLARINTLVCLHKLVAIGVLRLEGLSEINHSRSDTAFTNLRSAIDAYQMLHGAALQAFSVSGVAMPVQDLIGFGLALNRDGLVSLYLDPTGNLAADSISDMLNQCASNVQRLQYFQGRVESLIRFLMQMSCDILPYDYARDLKRQFKEILS